MHPESVLPQWTASAIYVGSQLDLSPLHFKLQWDTVPTPERCEQGTNPRPYRLPWLLGASPASASPWIGTNTCRW
jgi:hypothetical protein